MRSIYRRSSFGRAKRTSWWSLQALECPKARPCLPSFEGLAKQIGSREQLDQGEKDRLDWYLGQLVEQGVRVHDRAADILTPDDSKPTALHRDLLRLFETPERVRLVTTNFDHHFESAAEALWSGQTLPEIWQAPGLPVGNDFRGLIYVHGRLGGPNERLVLTDADFGRAYLTEGWARRFLVRLFPEFTVLFVGYSHSDPVTGYLARGLPAESPGKRFALTDAADPSRWRYLGVEALAYDKGEHHASLREAVADWADLANCGALDQEARAREILSAPDRPLDPRDESFLAWCFDHPTHWRFFIEHAEDARWFSWLQERGLLEPLLREQVPASDSARRKIAWIAERSAADAAFSTRALNWLASTERNLPGFIRADLVQQTWRSWHTGAVTGSRDRIRQWVMLLLDRRPEGTRGSALEFLAGDLDPNQDSDLVCLLFDHFTEPHISTSRLGQALSEDLHPVNVFEFEARGEADFLSRWWTESLSKHLDVLGADLLVIGEHHLRKAKLQSDATGSGVDLLSLRRSVIPDDEADEASRHYEGMQTLIDTTRDAFLWTMSDRPDAAMELANAWIQSGVPLLKRIGTYGIEHTDVIKPEAKLRLLIEEGWLGDSEVRQEVLRLATKSYPQAEASTRTRLIEEARSTFTAPSDDQGFPVEADRQVRRFWGFLRLLHEADPSCELVERILRELEEEHPELPPREEQPAMDIPSAKTLLGWEPDHALERIDQILASEHDPFDAQDPAQEILRRISAATVEDVPWSIELAENLAAKGRTDRSLWRSLIRGWEEAKPPVEHWAALMQLFESHLPSPDVDDDLADLLEKRVKTIGDDEPTPSRFVDPAIPVARALFARSSVEADRFSGEGPDWLQLAINRLAGKVALFAVAAAAKLRKERGEEWPEVAGDLFELIDALLEPPHGRSHLGRPVLCSQLAFFFHNRKEWTKEKILPLFDWEKDQEAAAQAWHGFITWGRYSPELWRELLPYLEQTFDHLVHIEQQNRLGNALARDLSGAAFFLEGDPLDEGWLERFLTKATEDQRVAWASSVLAVLEELDPDERHRAWEAWLERYVKRRLEGMPPLTDREWTVMHEWALYLERDFPEVVDLMATKVVGSGRFDFLMPLSGQVKPRGNMDREALFEHTESLGRFLEHVAASDEFPPWQLGALESCLIELGKRGIDRNLFRRLVNRFLELDGRVSAELRALLDAYPPEKPAGQ